MQKFDFSPQRIFSKEMKVFTHDIYLTGSIESPENYHEEFEVIRSMTQNDVVRLHINTPGGYCSTAVQFMKCMKETEGTVVCIAEGECKSAGTFIFLSGHEFEVADHTEFMCHNYSGGQVGKGNEMWEKAQFERKWSRILIEDVYKDFLTQEEIDRLLDDRDIYLTPDEVIERVTKVCESRQAEYDRHMEKMQKIDARVQAVFEEINSEAETEDGPVVVTVESGGFTVDILPEESLITVLHEELGMAMFDVANCSVVYETPNSEDMSSKDKRKFLRAYTGSKNNLKTEDMERAFFEGMVKLLDQVVKQHG